MIRNRTSATAHGLAQGSFPVRYLGVPLTTKKLRKQDYQPLLDKIHARFSSWTIKHLSFVGMFTVTEVGDLRDHLLLGIYLPPA